MHVPIAVVDPHLSWYGEFRFYEMRIYGGELSFSGAAILGLPFPSLGHNRYLSIAMTTGGPDTSDVYEEEVQDGKYRFNDEWRPLEVRTRTHRRQDRQRDQVRRTCSIESTAPRPDRGPQERQGVFASPFRTPTSSACWTQRGTWPRRTTWRKRRRRSAGLQFMAQNIMIGTVDGDIYYVRNGRVPVRPAGCDTSRPMSGAAGACEWQGIHPFEDLVQITNPPQGYMQNCNVSPFAMMKDSPLVPEKWAAHPYLYNDGRRPPHQRAAMMLDLLDAAHDVTAEQAIGIAFSTAGVARRAVAGAHPQGRARRRVRARLLAEWNRRSDADSRAALAYYFFKTALGGAAARAVDPPAALTDDAIRAALGQGGAAAEIGLRARCGVRHALSRGPAGRRRAPGRWAAARSRKPAWPRRAPSVSTAGQGDGRARRARPPRRS